MRVDHGTIEAVHPTATVVAVIDSDGNRRIVARKSVLKTEDSPDAVLRQVLQILSKNAC